MVQPRLTTGAGGDASPPVQTPPRANKPPRPLPSAAAPGYRSGRTAHSAPPCHALAGAAGAWLTTLVGPEELRWILGISFIAMAVWTLVPDTFDEAEAKMAGSSVFGTTFVAFFLAEMGDNTQVATVALAARYHAFYSVVAGTTLGMMIANVPAVLLGDRIAHRLPVALVHRIAAAIFLILGVMTLAGFGRRFVF